MNTRDFGRLLKRARQAAGFRTQQELAERLGVDRSTVGAWETGRQYPQRFIGAIENLLGRLDAFDEPRLDPETERRISSLTDEQRDYLIDRLTALREAEESRQRRA